MRKSMLSSPVVDWGKGFLNKIDLSAYHNVLDIGCRQGHMSAHLAKKYKNSQFTAIDNLESETSIAKNNFSSSNLTFETVDALQLDCTSKFDAIISLSCLHWIQNKNQVLQNIFQSLKPGGKIFLQFFALHGRLKNDRFFYQTAQKTKWQTYFKKFIPEYSEITRFHNDINLACRFQRDGFFKRHLYNSCWKLQKRY